MPDATHHYVAVHAYGPYAAGDIIPQWEFSADEAKALIKFGAIAELDDGDKPAAVAKEAAKAQTAATKAGDKKS